ncbi:hypothetical protein [Streptomyces roseoverticillatus]|uniref:hypothetical protein n=1 Tax=Streptomyces roseoverticillatus TaxID=66429 RepID=UPI0004C1F88F|nr:hypothetical protein [Streptomyces roseoverticillatus]
MTDGWAWEYDPDPGFVIGGIESLAFIAKVEERADELVRAAAALYLDGAKYTGASPPMQEEAVDASGMFVYQVIPRHQRVYIRRVSFLGT